MMKRQTEAVFRWGTWQVDDCRRFTLRGSRPKSLAQRRLKTPTISHSVRDRLSALVAPVSDLYLQYRTARRGHHRSVVTDVRLGKAESLTTIRHRRADSPYRTRRLRSRHRRCRPRRPQIDAPPRPEKSGWRLCVTASTPTIDLGACLACLLAAIGHRLTIVKSPSGRNAKTCVACSDVHFMCWSAQLSHAGRAAETHERATRFCKSFQANARLRDREAVHPHQPRRSKKGRLLK